MTIQAYKCQCGCAQPIPPLPIHVYRPPRFLRGHYWKVQEHRNRLIGRANPRVDGSGITRENPAMCQCGCNQPIPWKPGHRYRKPRFIQAHYLSLGTHPRIEAMKRAQATRRAAPPQGWIPPTGLCECGCGKQTAIAKCSNPAQGQFCGFPKRFIAGHNLRSRRGPDNPLWKGGRYRTHHGYIEVHKPGHPLATSSGYVLEHRLVYFESRGLTSLPSSIHIHHLNGVRDDNRPENLAATTRTEHKTTHVKANAVISFLLDRRLNDAAVAYVATHYALPDLAQITQQVYAT